MSDQSAAKRSSSKFCSKLMFASVTIAIFSIVLYAVLKNLSYAEYTVIYPDNALVSERLTDLEKISTEPYSGCESLVYHNGSIYTGSGEGKILKINETGVHVFSQFGQKNCDSMATCGRPLGIRLSPDGKNLLVADSYLGLYSVSLTDGTFEKIFPVEQEDFSVTFFNDFDVLHNGTIILSESSTQHSLEHIMRIFLGDQPSGRLLSVDPSTGRWTQLLDGLHFSNGVQLHSDNQSVLVAETVSKKILRVPLYGGSVTTFADNLPGIPDNIRRSSRGGYWVPLSNIRGLPTSLLLDLPHRFSLIKTLALHLSEMKWFRGLRYTRSAMLVRLDERGKIVEVHLDPTRTVLNSAEVCEHDGVLYSGSYFLPYISRLRL